MLKKLFRVMVILIGVLALLLGATFGAGYFIEKNHTASRTATFKASPECIWNKITNLEAQPAWRKNLKEIKIIDGTPNRESWTEISKSGDEISFKTKAKIEPSRYEAEIINNSNFGGYWELTLEPAEDGGTKLTVTENGEIYNPMFRTIAAVFFDMHATIDEYLADLAAKLGETYDKP